MKKNIAILTCASFLLVVGNASATDKVSVQINKVSPDGIGDSIGTIEFLDTKEGLEIIPHLKGLPEGAHGFHIHENASCNPAEKDGKLAAAQAAGSHFDPLKTGKHEGPAGKGHEGDMPTLQVAKDGSATTSVVAPHLKVTDILHHSVMIHAGSDNYSDNPQPLGGGGARIACGVING